jgi:hypothetical protein
MAKHYNQNHGRGTAKWDRSSRAAERRLIKTLLWRAVVRIPLLVTAENGHEAEVRLLPGKAVIDRRTQDL